MRLWKPKAPKAPEGVAYQFDFPSDGRNPDGSYRQPAADLPINAAVERVQQALASLRTTVATANGLRSASALQADIERTTAEATAMSKVLERKRAQCVAGLIEIAEVAQIQRERDRVAAVGVALRSELHKRNAADEARTELDRILGVLR